MAESLHEIQLAFSRLERRTASLDEELFFGLSLDEALVVRVHDTANLLRRSQQGVLPPAPQTPPFLEAQLASDGSWEVAVPILEAVPVSGP
jgi:hypothetical protein